MKDKIAILLPYKEKYNINNAGAASIWMKDYTKYSKLKSITTIYGNQKRNTKPLTNNYKNIEFSNVYLSKNIYYTNQLYKEHLKDKFSIIEIHNRPESLIYLIKKKISSKLIFIFHNNPVEMRGSDSIKKRIFIAENTDQIYFVSNWVKNKFFEGLPYKNRNNCNILYPAIEKPSKFPKKEKLIIFSGKLNSSKGYDIFGKATLKILNEFPDWKAIAIGNEPREKYSFKHKNFKILDWLQHKKILNYYSKASISVVPSRWQEPFGRTAMESAAYGCATITSKNGGLPETFKNPIFLKNVNVNEIYLNIKKLIINSKKRSKIQKNNFQNVIHNIRDKVSYLDNLKSHMLGKKIYINKDSKLKIFHISQFDERNNFRLFNISVASKISKGFLRNDHDVINFSYRNYLKNKFIVKSNDLINDKVLTIVDNYRPNLIVLGHNNFLTRKNLELIKSKYDCKIIMWYEDALGHRGDGPNWRQNLNLLEKNSDLINSYFTTTHPDEIKTIINKKKINYLPIPVDENIENLEIYNLDNRYKDIFFALSHGVNYGKLKRGKKDEREIFLENLLKEFPKFNYNILGISNEPPKWNYEFMEELSKCKMALNLSRGKPIKYTSSNRIASLIGNGIYTFIDKKTKFSDFFSEDEVGSYNDVSELGNKIEFFLSNENKINKFGKNGRKKYFQLFNNKKIAKEVLNKIY
ncbi:glycosyltransferase [Pelagibacterales bacterium SAG-MED39]|nr:glycosyltransferase [Pelagibacterales bacterium SAG-MED39]